MLKQILGDTISKYMVPIKLSVDNVEIEGFLGKPETASTGYNQYIIVNHRPVKSKGILQAVLRGYGPTLAKGLYPAFVLYLDLDPHRIDVNIHPAKREIRIHREYVILQALTEQVMQVIQTIDAAPELHSTRQIYRDYREPKTPITVYNPPAEKWYPDTPRSTQLPGLSEEHNKQTALSFSAETGSVQHEEPSTPPVSVEDRFEGPLFLQMNNMYIITTIKGAAIIIDQHVAHERILYEQILGNLRGKPASAQQMLFPLTLDFSAADYDILLPMLPHLNNIGFGIREFGERSVIIEAIPSGMSRFENGKILYEFIEEMRVHGEITSGYIDKLAAALACRAAIKAGKPLNQKEMQYLVDTLFATQSPFVCPHGRPTVVKLTAEELNRRFGR